MRSRSRGASASIACCSIMDEEGDRGGCDKPGILSSLLTVGVGGTFAGLSKKMRKFQLIKRFLHNDDED